MELSKCKAALQVHMQRVVRHLLTNEAPPCKISHQKSLFCTKSRYRGLRSEVTGCSLPACEVLNEARTSTLQSRKQRTICGQGTKKRMEICISESFGGISTKKRPNGHICATPAMKSSVHTKSCYNQAGWVAVMKSPVE
jgi:hypothetical protein